MHQVSINPQWTIKREDGQSLSSRLLALLVQVHEFGSLSAACRHSGASYRHAWDLVRHGEALFQAPLLFMERGRGSRLTPLGEKLVWADRRISARLRPILESLASELEVEIRSVIEAESDLLRVHASHGFAIEKLLSRLEGANLAVERKYMGSLQAVASLHDGECDVAGFHVPVGALRDAALTTHMRWLDPEHSRVIPFVERRLGWIVAPGNPQHFNDVHDLLRPEIRFVNRQPGSGTRFLLDCLLEREGIDAARIHGYETSEYTHAAVAAYVASGMAHVAFGVEPPAREFKLEFIPVATEHYMLVCNENSLSRPPLRNTLDIMSSESFRSEINRLPGYRFVGDGRPQRLDEAFPDFPKANGTKSETSARTTRSARAPGTGNAPPLTALRGQASGF